MIHAKRWCEINDIPRDIIIVYRIHDTRQLSNMANKHSRTDRNLELDINSYLEPGKTK